MPNIQRIIGKHNNKVMRNHKKKQQQLPVESSCNCRKGNTCPLHGECLTSDLVYQATVVREDNNKMENYIGLTSNSFKTRYTGHTHTFRNKNKASATTLSQYVWDLQDNSIPYNIQWDIIRRVNSYSPGDKVCNLCIKEKYYIIYKYTMATLNTRNELASKCRHKWSYLLGNT